MHHDVAALIGAKNMWPCRSFLRQSDRMLLDLGHFCIVMQGIEMNEREVPYTSGSGERYHIFISAMPPILFSLVFLGRVLTVMNDQVGAAHELGMPSVAGVQDRVQHAGRHI